MYLLWDWNGTLLDDTALCLRALNGMMEARGLKPITLDYFRAHFAFPSRNFYNFLGMTTSDETWDAMAQEYHDRYHEVAAEINREAREALTYAKDFGFRQSIISALRQDFLTAEVNKFKLRNFFDYAYGSDNLNGGTKIERACELVERLKREGFIRGPLVLIGDSLHDKVTADAVGARSVLFSGGSHSAERLAAEAPTYDSLLDCVKAAAAWAV